MQRNLGSVHEYRTEGITKADEREGENGIGGGIEVGGRIGKRGTGPGRVEERRVKQGNPEELWT